MTTGLVIIWCFTAFFVGIITANLIDMIVNWRQLKRIKKEEKRKQQMLELVEMMKQAGIYNK